MGCVLQRKLKYKCMARAHHVNHHVALWPDVVQCQLLLRREPAKSAICLLQSNLLLGFAHTPCSCLLPCVQASVQHVLAKLYCARSFLSGKPKVAPVERGKKTVACSHPPSHHIIHVTVLFLRFQPQECDVSTQVKRHPCVQWLPSCWH